MRLRGLASTRLDTFVDAAFAIAITLLVISVGTIPGNFTELILALKAAPAFLAGFVAFLSSWFGHRSWSRRYGLEDGWTVLLSLALVFVMLVYVYPLRLVASAHFAWVTAGWLPSEFRLAHAGGLAGLLVVYGSGFALLTGLLAGLHGRALRLAAELGLDEIELLRTRQEILAWAVLGATGRPRRSSLCSARRSWGLGGFHLPASGPDHASARHRGRAPGAETWIRRGLRP